MMKQNRLVLLGLIAFIFLNFSCQKTNKLPKNLFSELAKLKNVKISTEQGDSLYSKCFTIMVKQPIDHKDTTKGFFWQRLHLSHKCLNRPVVFVTEGYYAKYNRITELAKMLNANQIQVEHRYFGKSTPDSIDWNYLNLEQEAADLHNIREIFGQIYTKKWLSTGISKGGQTTIAYRYFYPNDVAASVPYVAPLTFAREDTRIPDFIANKTGTKEYRDKVFAFQHYILKNKKKMMPYFKKWLKEKDCSFKNIGSDEKAFEMGMLEFSFAFWQWGSNPEEIPDINANIAPDSLMNYLITVEPFSFFSDQESEYLRSYFYQALSEMGIYTYDTKPFEDVLSYVKHPNFEFTMGGKIKTTYSNQLSKKIGDWTKNKGNNIIYIYGSYDPWYACGVEIDTTKVNALKLVKKGGSHKTRLSSFDEKIQQQAKDSLFKWLDI